MSGQKKWKNHEKKPVLGADVALSKRPKRAVQGKPTGEDPTMIWGFSYVDLDGPWGWRNIDPAVMARVLSFMHQMEAVRPNEILGRTYKRIELGSLCPEAIVRLTEIELDDLDCIWELHVSGVERIWGHRAEHVFYPIWWDPQHEVCPSKKKHT